MENELRASGACPPTHTDSIFLVVVFPPPPSPCCSMEQRLCVIMACRLWSRCCCYHGTEIGRVIERRPRVQNNKPHIQRRRKKKDHKESDLSQK